MGATLTRDLPLGMALLAACVFVPVVFMSLPLALAAWIPVAWNEFSHLTGKAPLAGTVLLLVGWIGTRRAQGAVFGSERSVRIAQLAFLVLLLWVTLSISWASDRPDAWSHVLDWCAAGGAFLLVTTVASTPARVRLLVAAFIAGALVSLVIGLSGKGFSTTADAIDLATRARFSGGAGDPNYLAAGLVAAIALAFGLMAATRDALTRFVLAASVVALIVGLAATESRGGLIAVAVAAVAAVALAPERRMQMAVLGVIGATVVATALLAFSPATLDRMTTFDTSGAGRGDLWRIAVRMAEDRPVVGFGIGSFEHEGKNYVLRPGNLENVDKIVDRPAVTHNVYLQQLAETGLVGLLALLAVCAACIAASQIAAGRFRARQDRAMDALARSATVAMVGLLAASVFISNSSDKRLWIVLALGPALLAVAGPPVRAPAQRESTER